MANFKAKAKSLGGEVKLFSSFPADNQLEGDIQLQSELWEMMGHIADEMSKMDGKYEEVVRPERLNKIGGTMRVFVNGVVKIDEDCYD
ncbi:hypothetical protein G7Y89_g3978 [Cudoniella acicularis]|uniref:Uncharacterized protein n=1 Tax=Cudoniella acicularis TaxID=354080 RepID=A0A8H4RQB9_9HELO|nr:hypothetical protein G7Y89_g3978 [Cudoniella acicularis]